MTTTTVTRIGLLPSGQIVGIGPDPLPGLPQTFSADANGVISQSAPSVVPLQPLASQRLSVTLGGQNCAMRVFFRSIQVPLPSEIPTEPPVYGRVEPCFLDLYTVDAQGLTQQIITGVICQDRNRIVRNGYLGFVGDLAFVDTQGTSDPEIATLGSRYLLTYWSDIT